MNRPRPRKFRLPIVLGIIFFVVIVLIASYTLIFKTVKFEIGIHPPNQCGGGRSFSGCRF